MNIAGYDVKISGELSDEDSVLIEDAVMFLNGKMTQTRLREITQVDNGYDLQIDFKDETKTVRLRHNAEGDWVIELPRSVDAVVRKMLV
jgi:hypothetical protein